MSATLRQQNPEFTGLGDHTFSEGDEIVFKHGLVDIHSHGRDNNPVLGEGMTDVLSHSVSSVSCY